MNYLSKIFKQTAWQILGKGVSTAATFVILAFVARAYGKEGTGIFTLALSYIAVFYLLADFGFNAHILKKGEEKWQKLLGTRLLWSFVLVVFAVVILNLLPFSSADFSSSVILGILAVFGSAVFTTCNLIFQKNLRYDLSVLASSIGMVFSVLFFLLLIFNRAPVPFLLIAHVFGWFVIAFTALALAKKFLSQMRPIFDLAYSINLFKEAWPIALSLALNVIYFRADAFLIAYFKNTSDVGIYNIAYSVFQSALVLPTFIMNAYYPLMLKNLSKVRILGLLMLVLSLLGTIITFLLAPLVINILAGPGFEDSVVSLRILSLGFPAFFVSALLMWLLVAKGRYKSMLVLYTWGLFVNVILNFIYIPQYSYLAASWITVASEYMILLVQIFLLRGILRK